MSVKGTSIDVIRASRRRSASLADELDAAPSSPPPPPPDEPIPDFPPVYKADSLPRANKVGSKVSQIKEMFQTNGTEDPKFKPIRSSSASTSRLRSPPPALQPKKQPSSHLRMYNSTSGISSIHSRDTTSSGHSVVSIQDKIWPKSPSLSSSQPVLTIFSSTGHRPASLCHGPLSVVRQCVHPSVH